MTKARSLFSNSLFPLSLSFSVVVVIAVVRRFSGAEVSATELLITGILVFLISAFFHSWFKKKFISQLRQVYQNIINITVPAENVITKTIPDEDIIPEINRMLASHEKTKADEIGQLKKLEVFRKEFLSNVSHELKTPIFSVQGYLHTLIDGGIDDPDVNLHYLNKASRSLDRLIAIVEDLESISRFESGNLNLEMRIFDICELCRDVLESLEIKALERGIKLDAKDITGRQVYVNADKERIRQVISNLVVNSIKYGKETGRTSISIEETPEQAIVHVEDDGIGIAKEHLPRLFERFYRVDKSRSREQGGTGLGLAIVKHIIEAHNQKVSVTSEPGKGSVFSFTLARG